MKKFNLVLVPLLAILLASCDKSATVIYGYPKSVLPISYYVSPSNFINYGYTDVRGANLHYQFHSNEIVHYVNVDLRFSESVSYIAVSGYRYYENNGKTFYLPIEYVEGKTNIINYFIWFMADNYCPVCGRFDVK